MKLGRAFEIYRRKVFSQTKKETEYCRQARKSNVSVVQEFWLRNFLNYWEQKLEGYMERTALLAIFWLVFPGTWAANQEMGYWPRQAFSLMQYRSFTYKIMPPLLKHEKEVHLSTQHFVRYIQVARTLLSMAFGFSGPTVIKSSNKLVYPSIPRT